MDSAIEQKNAQGLVNLNADELFNERVRFFTEFLDDDYGQNQYKTKVSQMLEKGEQRLIVAIHDLRQYNAEYAEGLLKQPMDFLPPFDKALKDVCITLQNPLKERIDEKPFYIGLEGAFGEHQVRPGNLNSTHIGTLVSIEGIVARCSIVRPKVARSIHYCEKTQVFHSREYRDGTSMANAVPTGAVYPKEDEDGNPLTTEFGFSTYRDYQTMSLQEMPERATAGQLPRPVDVILDDDLVDRVKPGDRVHIVGLYRSIGKSAASVSAIFKTIIIANNVRLLNKDIQQPTLEEGDLPAIKKIAKREDVFDLLSRSLAPSIFGHDYIKKAVLLLLLGGVEKNLVNGTHLRGDINMLLIGDPSTAKSQMLRFVLNTAPLGIATTGRGSSGVGLTAAVVQDKDTGERTLEAGAMVLADRGVVCIDEFDKMSDIDRVAIHEVMEQQTVTISKAGIHTSLNARCSVLAAANPAFGQYMDEKKPFENITLPDSILSRFDLVFVVLDRTDDEFNRAISEHVTRLHRYVPPGFQEGMVMKETDAESLNAAQSANQKNQVFQKYNQLVHFGLRTKSKGKKAAELLTISFIKKYIHYAKTQIVPVLTQESSDYIAARYSELRTREDGAQDKYRTMPITPRTLETLIRLSTAHARARLSLQVEMIDAEIAYEILVFALFKEVKVTKRVKRPKTDASVQSDTDDDESDENNDYFDERISLKDAHQSSKNRKNSKKSSKDEHDNVDSDGETKESETVSTGSKGISKLSGHPNGGFDLFLSRLNVIRQSVLESKPDDPSIDINELVKNVNSQLNDVSFNVSQVKEWVKTLSDENRGIWVQDNSSQIMFI